MTTAPPELLIEAGQTERDYWRDLFRYTSSPGATCWCATSTISNGRSAFPQQSLLLSLIIIAILLSSGIWYFRKTERTFADVI